MHLLTNCSMVDANLNAEAKRIMCLCNNIGTLIDPEFDLNCAVKDRPGSLFQPGPGPGPGSAKSAGTGILPGPGL